MKPRDRHPCIIIAVIESRGIAALWQAAMRRITHEPADLVTLFVEDERWRRAASLPFTKELPRVGGEPLAFTRQRARELRRETARQARQLIERLAAESERPVAFTTLTDSNAASLTELVGGRRSVLIAQQVITRQPVYARFVDLGCQIELVEYDDDAEHSALLESGTA
jgi:hypothetical protein